MDSGYHRTFYMFKSGEKRHEPLPTDNYFKYQKVIDVAFTTDPTGSNLPPKTPPWEFFVEVQVGQRYVFPIEAKDDRIWQGLDEKDWYVTKIHVGVSQYPYDIYPQTTQHPPTSPAAPPTPPPEEEYKLSPQAQSILNKILKR